MPRKIFISFLGLSNYGECKYIKENYKSQSVRYIQEATLEYLNANKWKSNDKAFVLVTEGSYNKNWLDNGHYNYNTKEAIIQSGLRTQLEKYNFPFEINDIKIKDGNSEQEIWDIFETIFNLLEDKDDVYIDVTHGFRYLPILSIVLSNYGKLLKNITVKSITYGNYESRNKETNEAPIIDLTSFSQLQDWANAANLFVNHGNLDSLVSLTKQEIIPILKKTKGKDKTASTLRKLSESMDSFSLAIKTNNVPDINKGQMFAEFKQYLSDLENELIKPLNPILEKVESKINNFSIAESVFNGLKAVDFCIESGLIQQGYTMLQESIVSLVLDTEELDVKNVEYRSVVSGSFKIKKEDLKIKDWKPTNYRNQFLTKQVLKNNLIISLASTFNEITDKRNIINHAGFNDKSSTKVFRKLEMDLKNFNRRVKEKLNL